MFDSLMAQEATTSLASLLPKISGSEEDFIISQLKDGDLLETGKAVILSFGALKEGLGHRWDARKDTVMRQVEMALARELRPNEWQARVNDTDVVVAMPSCTRSEVQARAGRMIRKILRFFIGDVQAKDARILEVTTLTDKGLGARSVGEGETDLIIEDQAPIAAPEAITAPEEDEWVPFMTSRGRMFRASCGIDPVFELNNIQIIGHRLDPRAWELDRNRLLDGAHLAELDWYEREQVDHAVCLRGMDRMRIMERQAGQPLLVIPVAFSTLSGNRGRKLLMEQLREASDHMRLMTIVELRDLEGVPAHRIAEIASILKPYCYRVIGNIAAEPRQVRHMSKCFLPAVSADIDMRHLSDQALFDTLRPFAAEARRLVGCCLVHGFTSLHQLAIGKIAGVTHGILRV